MGRLVHWVRSAAVALGAPGLFLISFADSSPFMTLPEIADLMVVSLIVHDRSRFVPCVIFATAGSLAGCLLTYYVGKKGGDALIRKRVQAGRVDRAMSVVQRYGVMAVLVPSILPPPAPFKIFVLLAGVADIGVARFSLALLVGRGGRYLVLGLLALWYGRAALAFIRAHATSASLVVAAVLVLGFVAYLIWTRRAGKRPEIA